jgi:lipopolysaccharide export system permease protein
VRQTCAGGDTGSKLPETGKTTGYEQLSMRILDRYILKRFGITLVFAMTFFVFVFIFVDMVGNLSKFIDRDVPRVIISQYYLFYVPYILTWVLPIGMLLASLFSIGQMARHNELAAIKSAGVSLYRIALPVAVTGMLISIGMLVFGEKIVPVTSQGKSDIEAEYLDTSKKTAQLRASDLFLRDKANRRVYINYYNHTTRSARKVSIQRSDKSEIIERIDAQQMKWQETGWVLEDGFKRSFVNGAENVTRIETYQDSLLDFSPDDLLKTETKPEDMSYRELAGFIAEVIRNGGDPQKWLVDLNFKLSIPFASFIMVLFGVPLASGKQKGGAVFSLIIGALVYIIYYAFTRFVQTLGEVGTLIPAVAAWLPNALFIVLALLMMMTARK